MRIMPADWNKQAPDRALSRYRPWTDPREHAFTLETPEGWTIDGGLYRLDASQVHVQVHATAPAKGGFVFIGDAQRPKTYVEPNMQLMQLGLSQGATYSPNGGAPWLCWPFQPADQYAQGWLQQRFPDARISAARHRPDIEQRYAHLAMQGGMNIRYSAGEFDLAFPDGRTGFLTVTTNVMPSGMASMWQVVDFGGFVAAPGDPQRVGAAFARMLGTIALNPQWHAQQNRMSTQAAEANLASIRQAREVQQQAFEQRWAAAEQQQRTYDERWEADANRQREQRHAMGNTVELYDPETGERFETQNDASYYWRDPRNAEPTAIGTDADFNPDPAQLRRLKRIGPDGKPEA